MLGDSLAVPSQQRIGRHDPAIAKSAGEHGSDCSEQGSVVVGERGSCDLASQHGVLVAEDDEFEVLGAPRFHCEPSEAGQEPVENAEHAEPGWRHQPWSAPTRDFPGGTVLARESVRRLDRGRLSVPHLIEAAGWPAAIMLRADVTRRGVVTLHQRQGSTGPVAGSSRIYTDANGRIVLTEGIRAYLGINADASVFACVKNDVIVASFSSATGRGLKRPACFGHASR